MLPPFPFYVTSLCTSSSGFNNYNITEVCCETFRYILTFFRYHDFFSIVQFQLINVTICCCCNFHKIPGFNKNYNIIRKRKIKGEMDASDEIAIKIINFFMVVCSLLTSVASSKKTNHHKVQKINKFFSLLEKC